ncbi:MAG: hypothetical protein KKA19_06715, partial [Candidatus Margulisbacteria bacterium]|nr:hypothetical protein [Candidatus Margulisiibacteriota bacterium]
MTKCLNSKTIAAVKNSIGIVFNYVGYPAASLNSFQNDSGLGVIKRVVEKIKIFDFASVDIIKKMRPLWLRKQLQPIWQHIQNRMAQQKIPKVRIIIKLFIFN